jgi:hypothetical protein
MISEAKLDISSPEDLTVSWFAIGFLLRLDC